MERGYIHIYTGNGKGKTTSALGLSLRALCAGNKVYFGQFVKGMKYSETKITEVYDNIIMEQYGRGCFIHRNAEQIDFDMARAGFEKCVAMMNSGDYDVVVFDEIMIAIYYKFLTAEEVLDALRSRTSQAEVILTGRYAPQELIDYADLVTEMKEIKHYYHEGVMAREGIEK